MAYLLLIMEPPGIRETRSAAEGEALYRRMEAFSADLKARGLLRLSQSLKSDAAGVRLRRHGGRSSLVDGPFAEWATIEVRELGACYE